MVATVFTGFVFADAAIAQHITSVQYVASLQSAVAVDAPLPYTETLPQVDSNPATTSVVHTVVPVAVPKEDVQKPPKEKKTTPSTKSVAMVAAVPFYSQFKDITAAKWQKVGCGIASMAMLINYYEPGEVNVDGLLNEGIKAGAYLEDAGWIHQGLINLATSHGLTGATHDLSGSDMDTAFTTLTQAVKAGPVMASVHYTFNPKNPIPHLVVVSGIKDGMVYFNDPAGKVGGESISEAKFQRAWKKRYIGVHPV